MGKTVKSASKILSDMPPPLCRARRPAKRPYARRRNTSFFPSTSLRLDPFTNRPLRSIRDPSLGALLIICLAGWGQRRRLRRSLAMPFR